MEPCNRCGAVDPLCMYGLMSHWFASSAGLALEGGYFYLCPRCFDATIAPDLEAILDKLREHLPAPPTTPHAGFMHTPGDGQAPPPRARPRESGDGRPRNAETGPTPEPDASSGPAAT